MEVVSDGGKLSTPAAVTNSVAVCLLTIVDFWVSKYAPVIKS